MRQCDEVISIPNWARETTGIFGTINLKRISEILLMVRCIAAD